MTLTTSEELVSVDEFLKLPANEMLELVNGHVVEKQVSYQSAAVEVIIAKVLESKLQGAQVLSNSLAYRCFPEDPDRIRRPDVSVVTHERFDALSKDDVGVMPIVPDLAVEVVSPNDLACEVSEKINEYLRAGFPLVWRVDPLGRTVLVFPAARKPQIFSMGDIVTLPSIDPNFSCSVDELFPSFRAKITAK